MQTLSQLPTAAPIAKANPTQMKKIGSMRGSVPRDASRRARSGGKTQEDAPRPPFYTCRETLRHERKSEGRMGIDRDLLSLIEAMSSPPAYPHPVGTVEVRQTHISVVFLAGTFAYKVKKPVLFDFLDFSTLDKRRHFCEEEVRLNRRLAADVYLGVVPVAAAADGVRVEGEGEVVEWAVKMERLPESATFRDRLRRGELKRGLVEEL